MSGTGLSGSATTGGRYRAPRGRDPDGRLRGRRRPLGGRCARPGTPRFVDAAAEVRAPGWLAGPGPAPRRGAYPVGRDPPGRLGRRTGRRRVPGCGRCGGRAVRRGPRRQSAGTGRFARRRGAFRQGSRAGRRGPFRQRAGPGRRGSFRQRTRPGRRGRLRKSPGAGRRRRRFRTAARAGWRRRRFRTAPRAGRPERRRRLGRGVPGRLVGFGGTRGRSADAAERAGSGHPAFDRRTLRDEPVHRGVGAVGLATGFAPGGGGRAAGGRRAVRSRPVGAAARESTPAEQVAAPWDVRAGPRREADRPFRWGGRRGLPGGSRLDLGTRAKRRRAVHPGARAEGTPGKPHVTPADLGDEPGRQVPLDRQSGLTASHHSRSGQEAASSWKARRRNVPACSARHASSASGEVNASTWVRESVVQVPHPAGARPAMASAATGRIRSTLANSRKYCSWSPARNASRIAASASVAGSQSFTATPFALGRSRCET